MGATSLNRLLLILCGLAVGTGCLVVTTGRAGQPCEADADCEDGDYVCRAVSPLGPRTCQVRFPPGIEPEDAGSVEPAFWCGEVEPLLVQYCQPCHGPDRTGAGVGFDYFRLDVYEDLPDGGTDGGFLSGAKTMANRARIRVTEQTMPPFGNAQPTDEERETIARWAETGARFCPDGGP